MKGSEKSGSTSLRERINWLEIIIFYALAVLVSAPFRLGLINVDNIARIPYGLGVFLHILKGIGPAVGFVFVFYILKSKVNRSMTFWGQSRNFSLIAILVIPLGLTIAGVENNSGFNQHYFGLIYGIMLVFYALGEEFGWRGYLQQALAPMKAPFRIFLIAVLWYFWHLNFLLPDFTVKTHLIFFGFLLLGSWGLQKISEGTGSILFVAAVHLSFNVLSDVHADFTRKLVVILVSAAVWTLLIINLKKLKQKESLPENI